MNAVTAGTAFTKTSLSAHAVRLPKSLTTKSSDLPRVSDCRKTASLWIVVDPSLFFQNVFDNDGIMRIDAFVDQEEVQFDIFDWLVFLNELTDQSRFIAGHGQHSSRYRV